MLWHVQDISESFDLWDGYRMLFNGICPFFVGRNGSKYNLNISVNTIVIYSKRQPIMIIILSFLEVAAYIIIIVNTKFNIQYEN